MDFENLPRDAAELEAVAKKAKKAKVKKRKPAKPKTKKKAAKTKHKVTWKKGAIPRPKRKARPARVVVRTERLDMRLSKAEKEKVSRIAKKLKRTLTSIVYEAIENLK